MRPDRASSEKGQAILLVVVAMVVLLGFTALAVDGSMLYSDRRFSQSSADAASLAGGGTAAQWLEKAGVSYEDLEGVSANCSGVAATAAQKARQVAIQQAQANDFTIDQDLSDSHGVETVCGDEPVMANMAGGGQVFLYADRYMDVRTMITHETQTAFAHFIFGGLMRNTVTAVTRIHPNSPLAYGFAIVALNPANCGGKDGMIFSGNSATPVFGGGAFSNGCMSTNGGGSVTITDGSALYFDTHKPGGIVVVTSGYANGQLASSAPRIPPSAYDIPVPNCNAGNTHDGSWLDGQTNLSGLVCISGNATIHDEVRGTNVTLVFMGGKLTMNAQAEIDLVAPPNTYTGEAIPGVAIYFPVQYYGPSPSSCGNVNQEIKMNGGSDSQITGSIIAPCSDVSLEGGANTMAYQSQVIGWNVNIGGGGDLTVIYDGEKQHKKPALLDMFR